MALSAVQICNMALLRCGAQTISSLEETSREGELCKLFYGVSLSRLLRAHEWKFAVRRAILGRLTATAPTNWSYAYALPVDCARVCRMVLPGNRVPRWDANISWEYGIIDGNRAVFCDEEALECEYITDSVTENLFDPIFCSALAWLMVTELATPLMGKPELAQSAKKAYLEEFSLAAAQNQNEGQDIQPESIFVSERGML